MTIEDHIEMGLIIKTVLASSGLPYGAHNRLNSVRSTLEDWMSLELRPGQLNGPDFFDVYYREPDDQSSFAKAAKTRSGQLNLLAQLSHRLMDRYENCLALRSQLQKISKAALIIERACQKSESLSRV